MSQISLYLYILVAVALLLLVAYLIFKAKKGGSKVAQEMLDLRLLSLRLPRNEGDEAAKEKNELTKQIMLSEQVFAALAAIKQPFVFEVSVLNKTQDILFYVAVPKQYVEFAARQIQGVFLDAQIEEISDYTIFAPGAKASAAYMRLKDSFVLPIRTYKEAEADTFGPILSSFSKLATEGEGASLQMVAIPSADSTKKSILSSINSLKKGTKLSEAIDTRFVRGKDIAKIGKSFLMTTDNDKKDDDKTKPIIIDEDAIKALQQKIAKPLFEVNLRIITAATVKDRAEDLLLSIGSAFAQFSSPQRNTIECIKPKDVRGLIFSYAFREFKKDESMLLNTEEMASMFHLPTTSSSVPYVKWLKDKEAPPPENLPNEGIILGESVFRGDTKLVKLTDEDRRRHLYSIGQTGSGKTALLASLAAQDIRNGKGVCIIDPNTDFFNLMIANVPKERIEDVIIFDPSDMSRPVGLNMLEYDLNHPEQRSFVVNEMLTIFDKLYDLKTTGGPMFELYFRNALLLLTECAQYEKSHASLLDVQRLFTDDEYRNRKLELCKDPLVVGFWQNASKRTGEGSLPNMTTYITSKFTQFVNNDYMRPIIGQQKSAFDFRKIMDEGKILFVNLPKGVIGEMNANLLGMIIVGKLMMAAFGRVDQEEKDRRDFYLYMDEFQNFTTDTIGTILSEARKYRLCLTVANQFINQLGDKIRDAIFGNVGSMIAFRVGVPDTETLGKQFEPVFNTHDLTTSDNLFGHTKMLIGGVPTRPFLTKVIFAPRGNIEVREKLKELSRLIYGQDRREVDENIFARLKR
ncbi:MAG: type IV secretion system DNA-binding domain-containing protein [Candidatus Vogelbacteria bacterium]|nr:type IV secretion system DNA-binding domain-containing protein [Candidatus Vogelbacteria bacterium]